jgi:serine phosphatase RsbU (regulator of sigma subunit)
VLEPSGELGGDAFDHSLIGNGLHTTILDSMGHDLPAGLTSSVALAGCRNARRNGSGLEELVAGVDQRIQEIFPDRFCTGVFGDLDLDSGVWKWINCGHPAPLLLREERLVPDALERPPELPLGLGHLNGARRSAHEIQLHPGDRVLFYSDGIVEALSKTGRRFGLENFTDFIIRATAAGVTTFEVLRLLSQAIVGYHGGQLQDDATILLFEWRDPRTPPRPDQDHEYRHSAPVSAISRNGSPGPTG